MLKTFITRRDRGACVCVMVGIISMYRIPSFVGGVDE